MVNKTKRHAPTREAQRETTTPPLSSVLSELRERDDLLLVQKRKHLDDVYEAVPGWLA